MTRKSVASPLPSAQVFRLPSRLSLPRQAESPSPISERAAHLGEQVRQLREAAGLSGGRLAQKAGLSRSMLSRIERGLTSPSIDTLDRIASALDVAVSRFFNARTGRLDLSHVPSGKGLPIHRLSAAGHHYALLGQVTGSDLAVEPCMVEVDAQAVAPVVDQHPGLKLLYVLQGSADYRYGAKTVGLHPGDTVLFEANAPHGVSAIAEAPLRYLSIVFRLRS